MAWVWFPASTVSDGPAVAAGEFRVTVMLPDLVGSSVLVAVTVTVGGAGYGVVKRPPEVMVPGLKMLFGGEDTAQVTALLKLPVPETTGVNCC